MLLLDTINCDGPLCVPTSGAVNNLISQTEKDLPKFINPQNNKSLLGKAKKCTHHLPVGTIPILSIHRILVLLLDGFTTELLLHLLGSLVDDATSLEPSSLDVDHPRRQLVHKRLILGGILNLTFGALGLSVRSNACQSLENLEAAWASILSISMKG